MAKRKHRNIDARDAVVTKGLGAGSKPKSGLGNQENLRWWVEKGQAQSDAIDGALSMLWEQHKYRLQRLHDFGWLYGNASASFTIGGIQGAYKPLRPANATRVTYNI